MESRKVSRTEIEDRAAALLAQRDSDQWGSEDQARLDAWLSESTAHRVAFLRLEAVWEEAHRLTVLSSGRPRGTVPPRGEWRRSPFFGARDATDQEARRRDRRPLWFAAAATLLLALGIGISIELHLGGERYSTPIGGIASVPLRDGSHITLNTASQVRVDLTPTERRIDLDQGEAFFEVAKDPRRPFVVRAGDKRIIAVGTQFSVSHTGDEVRVVVTEGTVRFESATEPLHLEEPGSGTNQPDGHAIPIKAIPLSAGTIARAHDRDVRVQATPISQAEEILSWRQGYLTFHETALAEAIAQFNRYNVRQITIDDPAIASIRISGAFRATNADAFVRLLENGYAIHAHTAGDQTKLTKH